MKLRRTFSLLASIGLLLGVGLASEAGAKTPAKQPNIVYIIADDQGWADVGYHGSDIKTPTIDALSRRGLLGLCRTVPPGMAPGSDVANMSLLGFDPAAHHTGRGPIEAAALGLALAGDDVVFRLNTVTVSDFSDDGIMRDYSAGHIATEVSTKLVENLARDRACQLFGAEHANVQPHSGAQAG